MLSIFCLLVFFGYWSLSVLPRNKIDTLDAKLQAEGAPIRLADLAPEPVPEDENAAPLYLEAYRLLQSIKFEGEDIFYRGIHFTGPNSVYDFPACFASLNCRLF